MTKFITNQNIEIKLELAGLGDRILAFLIDACIIFLYILFVVFLMSILGSGGNEVLWFVFLLPFVSYSLLFEIFANGQTPGKKIRAIKVVKLDGGSPGILNYFLRWVLRPIDILIYGSIAVMSIIVTKNGQRIGDLAAGTTVIKLRASVNLSDVKSIKRDEGHQVIYPQVKRLNDKQIELIRAALHMRRDGHNDQAAIEIAEKTKRFLNIEDNKNHLSFLYTILKDYEHLHSS